MYQALLEILVDDLQLDEKDVRPDADPDAAGLDSLAIVELSMLLKSRLHIEISDDELLHIGSIAEISRLMEERVAA